MDLTEIVATQFDAAPFWEAARDGRLVVARCTACGFTHHYPRQFCPFCRADAVEMTEASGRGTIYSLSVSDRGETRHVLAYVTLAEGPTMMTRIVDAPADIAIGDAVTVDFQTREDGMAVPVFRKD